MADLGHLEPRREKRTQWVQDQWTGEMVEYEVDALVFDLSTSPPVSSGETMTFTWTQTLSE